MTTSQDITWYQGQTEEWTLSILKDDGTPDDLTDALLVELEVKPTAGARDPATIHLDSSSWPATGVHVRTQTGLDIGVCDVVATAAQTYLLTGGTWAYDVFVTRADGGRKAAMRGALTVQGAVNFP